MAETIDTQLPQDLQSILQKERFVTLATIDYESGAPNVSAVSWVYAVDETHIRIAISKKSRVVENISKKTSSIVLNIIGAGSCYSIAGEAQIAKGEIPDIPIKLVRIDVDVKEVRDVMFYGARISVDPEYEKTYDAEAAAKLDQQVMDALKK